MVLTTDPAGLRLAPLRAWMLAKGIEASGPLVATLLAGGRSNLSYRIDDEAGSCWVLRRPPLGHVLPSAHDMGREYRVLAGLNRVGFPAPRAVGNCEDDTVLGAPFMLMEFVPGRVVDSPDEAAELGVGDRSRVSASLVESLARLHAVDPEAAGLSGLGRPTGYLDRQVDRWTRQWGLTKTRDLAGIEELSRRLAADVADAPALPAVVVHGDFRIDNAILDPVEPAVRAVLDWEMATLGDPVADLAVMLVYWTQPDDGLRAEVPVAEHITDQPGFWAREQLIERYAELSGSTLDSLDFCTALACFKLAVIMESIRYRALAGQQLGTAASDAESMGRATEVLAELGLAVLSAGTITGLRQ